MKGRAVVLALTVILFSYAGVVTTASAPTNTPRSDTVPREPTNHQEPSSGTVERAHGEVIVIAIENNASNRSIAPMVRDAASYWAANSVRYTGYRFEFRVRPNASNPTYRVHVVDTIEECGRTTKTFVGCSAIVDPAAPVTELRIRVVDGLSREALTYTLKHELGHTLGLKHGDQPTELMAPYSNVTRARDG